MTRSTRVLAACLLSAAMLLYQSDRVEACTDAYFQQKIHYLDNYDPTTLQPPIPSADPVDRAYTGRLTQAFDNAPGILHDGLCGVDAIFIVRDASSCNDQSCFASSFGIRVRSANPVKRYIGISQRFLDWWPTLGQYETALITEILSANRNWLSISVTPKFATAGIDSRVTAVLAALAHEMGHIVWYDTFDPLSGYSLQQMRMFRASLLCNGDFFASWMAGAAVQPPPIFRDFLTRPNRRSATQQVADTHKFDQADFINVDNNFGATAYIQAVNLLAQIYATTGTWASAFAAVAPDEDFVETYKFNAVVNALNGYAPTNLPVNISIVIGGSPWGASANGDIVGDYLAHKKDVFANKVTCVSQAPLLRPVNDPFMLYYRR